MTDSRPMAMPCPATAASTATSVAYMPESMAARSLAFRLNSDDLIFADADHAIEMRADLLYVHVRGGMWAKLARPVYYELANLSLAENPENPSIWSKGTQFTLASSA